MAEPIQSFRDLIVWQQARILVRESYKLTSNYPKSEMFGLTQQIRTCVLSVQANIAEGSGRGTTKEFLHFLKTARGSLTELESYTIVVVDLGFSGESDVKVVQDLLANVGRLLSKLIAALELKERNKRKGASEDSP